MKAFGPVPSRRLGQSLGINNIPPKICSYNCIYCQVGPTTYGETERREFYEPEEVFQAVKQKVDDAKVANNRIDYLTFVPDGEATLDINLGKTIELLQALDIKIAIITNASLLWRKDVQQELKQVDYVSVKMDAVDEASWKQINRPNANLSLEKILDGVLNFSKIFKGKLVTETMLVKGINDSEINLKATAQYLGKLNPSIAYIAVPTRPPSESWVKSPEEKILNKAYRIFSENLKSVDYLLGFSGDPFSVAGDAIRNLLEITSVHPIRENEALAILDEGGGNLEQLDLLVMDDKLERVMHNGVPFYIRKFPFLKHAFNE